MLTWKRVISAIVVLAVAIVVSGVAILKSIDVNEYRGLIAERVEAATGRKLDIAGRLNLELSLHPALAVEGVTFANAPWGSRPEMMRLERMAAEVELLPMLSGDVRVKRLVLSGLDLVLETDKKGRGNWETAAPGAASKERRTGDDAPARLPAVHAVTMNDITVTYLDGASGRKTTFHLERLGVQAGGIDAPMRVQLAGQLDRLAFEADGTLGPAKTLLRGGDPYAVDLTLRALGTDIAVKGTMARPRDMAGLDLALRATGADLDVVIAGLRPHVPALTGIKALGLGPFAAAANLKGDQRALAMSGIDATLGRPERLRVTARGAIADVVSQKGLDLMLAIDAGELVPVARAAGLELPPLPPIALSGRLSDSRGGYALDGLQAKIGASDLSGRVSVLLRGVVRPTVEARLSANTLDVDALLPGEKAAKPAAPADGRVFPADPLPLGALTAADARLRLDAKRLIAGGLELADVEAMAVLGAGRLDLKPIEVTVAGGRVRGDIVLDGSGLTPALSLNLDARGVDYGRLLKQYKLTDIASGALDAKINAKGRGGSVRAVMAGLEGHLRVVTEGGKVESGLLNILSADVTSALPFFESKGDKDIQCVVVDFDIRDGQAAAKTVLFETGGLSMIGTGKIDLATEKIAMHVEPRAKKVSVLKLASVPFDIGGTLASPDAVPDVAGAAVGTVTGAVSTAKDIAQGVAKGGVSALGKIVGLGRSGAKSDGGGAVDQTDYCKLALAGKSLVRATSAPSRSEVPAAAKPAPTQPKPETTQEKLDKKLDEIGKGLGGSLKGLFGK